MEGPRTRDAEDDARKTAERVARLSYGRLVAILSARNRDLAGAEDALATALERALATWPTSGLPSNPEGWLLKVAQNRIANGRRHAAVVADAVGELLRQVDERQASQAPVGDPRVPMLFVCAHPAIDPASRTPLMLQVVLGLDAQRIAGAFLVPPATMSQRLVRAKARIKGTGLRFAVPDAEELPARLADVLQAVYGAYGLGWDEGGLEGGLPDEAIDLARLVAAELPQEPEAKGLLALMLHTHARRKARRGVDGAFIPLADQDASLWDREMVVEAEGLLVAAARSGRFGRFQCEAAIQSVHAQRGITGKVNLPALDLLYSLLVSLQPTAGALTAHAAVRRELGDADGALRLLRTIDDHAQARYQPALVLEALILRDRGDIAGATRLREAALALTSEPALRIHIALLLDAEKRK
jgi:RNA polymerase sigma-70 factor (ECF subfamily)